MTSAVQMTRDASSNEEPPLQKAAKERNQREILRLLKNGESITDLYSKDNSDIEGIQASTLEKFLDGCISVTKERERQFSFCYKFLSDKESEIGVIKNISKSKRLRHLLRHPVLSTFIDLKWKKVKVFYYLNVFIYTLLLALVNSYVILLTMCSDSTCKVTSCVPNWIWMSILILLLYMCSREFFELLTDPDMYFRSVENWTEILLILLLPLLIATNRDILSIPSDMICETQRVLTAILPLLCWCEWFLLTGRVPLFSIYVHMLKRVFITFVKFMFFYSAIIISFAISFYILFHKEDNGQDTNELFQDIPSSLFRVVLMMAGEFEADNIPFENSNIISQIVFMTFIMLVAMVMFNLLIGLAVNDTRTIKKKADISSHILRVKSVLYIEFLLSRDDKNPITKAILKTWPISLFDDMGNEMKIYLNSRGCVSYKLPFEVKHNSLYVDVKIIRKAKDILSGRNTNGDKLANIEDKLRKGFERLDDLEENNNRRLDDMEENNNRRLDDMEENNNRRLDDMEENNNRRLDDMEENNNRRLCDIERKLDNILTIVASFIEHRS